MKRAGGRSWRIGFEETSQPSTALRGRCVIINQKTIQLTNKAKILNQIKNQPEYLRTVNDFPVNYRPPKGHLPQGQTQERLRKDWTFGETSEEIRFSTGGGNYFLLHTFFIPQWKRYGFIEPVFSAVSLRTQYKIGIFGIKPVFKIWPNNILIAQCLSRNFRYGDLEESISPLPRISCKFSSWMVSIPRSSGEHMNSWKKWTISFKD